MPAQSDADFAAESLQPPDPQTSHRLFQLGCLGLAAALVWLVRKSPLEDPLLLVLGSLVVVAGALPALNWARKGDAHFPVFEVFMLASIPFYGISLLAGHSDLVTFSNGATVQAAAATLLYQVCAIVAFMGAKGKPAKSPMFVQTLLPASTLRFAQTGIWLNTAYLYANAFTEIIPYESQSVLRSAFFGIGTVSVFIEMRRWGAGTLLGGAKMAISLNLVAQLVFLVRDLYLIQGISLLLLALLAYVSTSRRIPLVVIAVVLPIVAVLHSGKPVMRHLYWGGKDLGAEKSLPSLTELPAFFEEWFAYGLQREGDEGERASASLAGRLFERASLFQMLCLVTERTPDVEPFLAGESYVYLPAQLVPRFLWPGKPSSLQSNVLLAIHYRLIPEDAAANVSIAFGMIAESYANFSFLGCAVLGLVLGYLYKQVTVAALGCPQFSALGLFTILLCAWSFQAEQIFATWVVSLIQAAAMVIGVPMVFRILFRQE